MVISINLSLNESNSKRYKVYSKARTQLSNAWKCILYSSGGNMTLANELWSSSIISTITSDKAAQAFLNFSLFFSIDEDIYNQNTLQKSCNTLLNNIVATNGIIFPNVYQLNQTKQFNYSLSSNTKYSNNSSIRKLDEDCNAMVDIIYVNGILTESMDEYYFLNYSGMTDISN